MPVMVEVVLLSVQQGEIQYRIKTGTLADREHPDPVARALAGVGAGLLHSTSWRFAGDAVVVTYAALPDPCPVTARRLAARDLPHATDPLSPGSAPVEERDIVAHACRHLALLRRTDPLVAAAPPDDLWDALSAFEPGLAGAILGA